MQNKYIKHLISRAMMSTAIYDSKHLKKCFHGGHDSILGNNFHEIEALQQYHESVNNLQLCAAGYGP
jgi:hypothetical protein